MGLFCELVILNIKISLRLGLFLLLCFGLESSLGGIKQKKTSWGFHKEDPEEFLDRGRVVYVALT